MTKKNLQKKKRRRAETKIGFFAFEIVQSTEVTKSSMNWQKILSADNSFFHFVFYCATYRLSLFSVEVEMNQIRHDRILTLGIYDFFFLVFCGAAVVVVDTAVSHIPLNGETLIAVMNNKSIWTVINCYRSALSLADHSVATLRFTVRLINADQ